MSTDQHPDFFARHADPLHKAAGAEVAVATAKAATAWRAAGPDTRAGVATEILARLNAASFEIRVRRPWKPGCICRRT